MSLPMDMISKCAICGEESHQTVLASTNRFGEPNLDLRPPEMMRSTMCWWIQECPHCGYVSKELGDHSVVTAEWLQSHDYKSCGGRTFKSDLSERFYKYYLINLEDNNEKDAFFAVLHAAWACDDTKDVKNAIFCRKLALEKLEKVIVTDKNAEELIVLRADLLRRTGQFDVVIKEYLHKKFSLDMLNQIIAFQIARSKEKDVRCYTVDDATNRRV